MTDKPNFAELADAVSDSAYCALNRGNPRESKALEEAAAALRYAGERIGKLPVTRDGVPVVPGDKLHPHFPDVEWERQEDDEDSAIVRWCVRDLISGELIEQYEGLVIETCYSTREAAEAARNAKEAERE